jgi:hydrogenase maturation protease
MIFERPGHKGASVKSVVEQIADAVLYEGYMLYPYRPSSLKNRQRWNFGICPRVYSEAQHGNELWRSRTEILALGPGSSAIRIKLRFLHPVCREVAQLSHPVSKIQECSSSDFHIVQSLKIGDRLYQAWQEAVEQEVNVPELILDSCQEVPSAFPFHFPFSRTTEPIPDEDGRIIAALIRTQQQLDGYIEVNAECIRGSLFRVRVELSNLTHVADGASLARAEAMMHSLASSHLILSIDGGEFISLLDPPDEMTAAASECQSIGAYPVLAGEEGLRTTMLASPVILYDYPKIALESAGDLFDGTEIDEILTLRIMALTDEEKSEMRQSDERARRILDRIEADPEHLAKLHGTVRNISPAQNEQQDLP